MADSFASHTATVAGQLAAVGVSGVPEFAAKLKSNSSAPAVYRDLLAEAAAAATLAHAGFRVEMRDAPDLCLSFGSLTLFAEVKHFRVKQQDAIDAARLSSGLVVPYGNTVDLEGISGSDQLLDVVRRKLNQFKVGHPNVLVIESSSLHCIEDCEVRDVLATIEDLILVGDDSLRALSGILFLSRSINCRLHRNVYFFPNEHAIRPVPADPLAALHAIHFWRHEVVDVSSETDAS
jgi:hypothetical protein